MLTPAFLSFVVWNVIGIVQLNLGMYTKDEKAELSVLVDRASGGASIKDGEIELMLHRRTCMDDGRGVEESLEEDVCVDDMCSGLTVRGNYYVSINKLGEGGARWRRETAQQIYSPLLMAFTHETKDIWKASTSVKGYAMDPLYAFPPNIALLTLHELDLGNVLLRLAHIYEVIHFLLTWLLLLQCLFPECCCLQAGEDGDYSKLAKVELKKLFSGKVVSNHLLIFLSSKMY